MEHVMPTSSVRRGAMVRAAATASSREKCAKCSPARGKKKWTYWHRLAAPHVARAWLRFSYMYML